MQASGLIFFGKKEGGSKKKADLTAAIFRYRKIYGSQIAIHSSELCALRALSAIGWIPISQ